MLPGFLGKQRQRGDGILITLELLGPLPPNRTVVQLNFGPVCSHSNGHRSQIHRNPLFEEFYGSVFYRMDRMRSAADRNPFLLGFNQDCYDTSTVYSILN